MTFNSRDNWEILCLTVIWLDDYFGFQVFPVIHKFHIWSPEKTQRLVRALLSGRPSCTASYLHSFPSGLGEGGRSSPGPITPPPSDALFSTSSPHAAFASAPSRPASAFRHSPAPKPSPLRPVFLLPSHQAVCLFGHSLYSLQCYHLKSGILKIRGLIFKTFKNVFLF